MPTRAPNAPHARRSWVNAVQAPVEIAGTILPGVSGSFGIMTPRNGTLTSVAVAGANGTCGQPDCAGVTNLVAGVPVVCTFNCTTGTTAVTPSFSVDNYLVTGSTANVTAAPVNGDTFWCACARARRGRALPPSECGVARGRLLVASSECAPPTPSPFARSVIIDDPYLRTITTTPAYSARTVCANSSAGTRTQTHTSAWPAPAAGQCEACTPLYSVPAVGANVATLRTRDGGVPLMNASVVFNATCKPACSAAVTLLSNRTLNWDWCARAQRTGGGRAAAARQPAAGLHGAARLRVAPFPCSPPSSNPQDRGSLCEQPKGPVGPHRL
jgi:hypothetical protein